MCQIWEFQTHLKLNMQTSMSVMGGTSEIGFDFGSHPSQQFVNHIGMDHCKDDA